MKITRLLVVFFILFGSAMTLSHAGNQPVRAAAPSQALDCCNPCPPICPPSKDLRADINLLSVAADAAALLDTLKSADVSAVEIGEVLPLGKPLIRVE